MKEILPVGIWYNGQIIQVNYLQLFCMNDNLVDIATFNYALIYKDPEIVYTLNPVPVVQGTLVMTGTEYETDWETNDQAWNWTAKKLNLTFTSTSTTTTTTII
jgi:hypothetical protein